MNEELFSIKNGKLKIHFKKFKNPCNVIGKNTSKT